MTASIDHGLTSKFLRTLYMLEEPAGILRYKTRSASMFNADAYSAERKCAAWNGKYAGKIVGCNVKGYIHTSITMPDGEFLNVSVHNIVWCLRTDEWPTSEIDHKNRNKSDNSEDNLRPATHAQQIQNVGIKSNNTSGIVGVYWYNDRQKWAASITVQGDTMHLGFFADKIKAATVRRDAELKYFGEFARCA